MAHFVVVEVSGGGYGLIDCLINEGHSFTFFTQDINTYLRLRSFKETSLPMANDIFLINPYSYDLFLKKITLLHSKHHIDGILCSLDFRLPDIASIAKEIGVPFLNPETCKLLRSKYEVRNKLSITQIKQPKYFLVKNLSELKTAINNIGLPVVVKPNDGYASIGVLMIRSQNDLEIALKELPEYLDYGLGEKSTGSYIVEELIDGDVISCEVLVAKEKISFLGITDRSFNIPNSPVEFGGCFPSTKYPTKLIQDTTYQILKEINFDQGAAHIELIVNDNGIYLVEVNGRLIGGALPKLLSLALGRSVYKDIINISINPEYILPEVTYEGIACIMWLYSEEKGILKSVNLPSPLPLGVKLFDYCRPPRSPINPPKTNNDRIAYIMTLASDQNTAEQFAMSAKDKIKIELE